MKKFKFSYKLILILYLCAMLCAYMVAFLITKTTQESFHREEFYNEDAAAISYASDEEKDIANEETHATLPVPISGKYPEMVMPIKEFAEPAEKVIYITIDDGPCSTTPQLLDVLDQLDVKTTFFVSGQFGSRETLVEQLKEINKRGHGVAVHSFSHKYQEIYSSVDAFLDDYKKVDDMIVEATGKRNAIYRFAGGSNTNFNEKIRGPLIAEMNSRGLIYHDWNAYDGAFDGLNIQQQINQSIEGCSARKRGILLMHNNPDKSTLIETLPTIVNDLKAKGYRFEVLDASVAPIQFIK